MPKVTFFPSGTSLEVEAGTTLLEASFRAEVKVQTTCGGKASCRLCVVRIKDGDSNISPMEFVEQSAMGNVFFITRERLACQTRVLGDVSVEVPDPEPPVKKKPFRPMRRG
jgi:uncharacterized 2Fe-2S/4Fe-4S cluster protein (DUF4445 family)